MDHFPIPIPLDHQQPPPHHPPTPPPSHHQQYQQPPPVSFPPPPQPLGIPAATAPATPPPYPEMIFAAITALKERDGSSKVAIAKYIEHNYSNLPSNHSNLLTQNLKRLKNAGHLSMVKKSYMLPRSDAPIPAPAQTNLPNNHQQNALPPAPPQAQIQAQPTKTGRGRGRPPKNPNAVKAQPVNVPIGLVDQVPTQQQTPAKRGRGRPRKIGGPAVVQKVSTGTARRPGRPKKLKPVRANLGSNGVAQVHIQAQTDAQPISYAYSQGNVSLQNVVGGPRRRGRPKKLGSGVAPVAAGSKAVGRPAGRPVGRPKKSVSRSGRPVGRPRKVPFLILVFLCVLIVGCITLGFILC